MKAESPGIFGVSVLIEHMLHAMPLSRQKFLLSLDASRVHHDGYLPTQNSMTLRGHVQQTNQITTP